MIDNSALRPQTSTMYMMYFTDNKSSTEKNMHDNLLYSLHAVLSVSGIVVLGIVYAFWVQPSVCDQVLAWLAVLTDSKLRDLGIAERVTTPYTYIIMSMRRVYTINQPDYYL